MKAFISTLVFIVVLAVVGAAAWLSAPRAGDVAQTVDGWQPDTGQAQSQLDRSALSSADNGYNWVTLPLDNAALVFASDLADDIAGSTGVTVAAVDVWDAATQSYISYDAVGASGDYTLAVGNAYRVRLTGGGNDVVWNIVGDVPEPDTFTYTLRETAASDYNWIMLPLDKSGMATASALAFDIESKADGAVDVLLIEAWQPAPQGFDTYNHNAPDGFPDGDFEVRIGYPYRVTVDVASGASVQWPVRP